MVDLVLKMHILTNFKRLTMVEQIKTCKMVLTAQIVMDLTLKTEKYLHSKELKAYQVLLKRTVR